MLEKISNLLPIYVESFVQEYTMYTMSIQCLFLSGHILGLNCSSISALLLKMFRGFSETHTITTKCLKNAAFGFTVPNNTLFNTSNKMLDIVASGIALFNFPVFIIAGTIKAQ